MPSHNTVHMELIQVDMDEEGFVWEYEGSSISEGQESFENAPIFNGRPFWDTESEIEWVDV